MDFILNIDELDKLQDFLMGNGWIAPAEKITSASVPGEGNMNYTLRIRTNFRTFIIKQSRDYVEKYPQISAPRERAVIEGRFYEFIQSNPNLREYTPELAYLDPENSVIVLEDLGESNNFNVLYQRGKSFKEGEVKSLTEFISILHNEFRPQTEVDLSNKEMRALNAEHIFHYPFLEENGLDLNDVTPGLQDVAMTYKTDAKLKSTITSLSDYYLKDGSSLLHGDYYPGSWLRTLNGTKIIDPEFCFYGRAEFDVSVFIAHLYMAEQPESAFEEMIATYEEPENFDPILTEKLTGVEIMRRIIGLAQLPLSLDLEEKEALLKKAYNWIMQ